jgi:hypothetical protein
VGVRWLGDRSLPTTRSINQIFLGVVFIVSSHLHDYVADLIACRLTYFMSAVACMQTNNFEAVEWGPYVAALDGASCSLQDGVKVFAGRVLSEALEAYVVLVPFLLVELGKCLHS